ncbi:MAG: class I SAM-dependent methyltransferase [Jiangellales bacterium]
MTAAARLLTAAQQAPWYPAFLEPVLARVLSLPPGSRLLDVGTGPGKLLELIATSRPDLQLVGADIDATMIQRAARRAALAHTPLIQTHPAEPLPFSNGEFDMVTLCSVLFLQPDPGVLLEEALRVLHPRGEIVVLTPTGHGNPNDVLHDLPPRRRGRVRNATLFLWHQATTPAGRRWQAQLPLAADANRHHLIHHDDTVMHGLATLERLHHRRP